MLRKSTLLFGLLSFLFLSCTTIDLQRKINPPLKSFVKVNHTVKILKCTEKFKNMCPVGEYKSMGSGIVLEIIENQTIVITAGHVCTSEVDQDKIQSYSEHVEIQDYRGLFHQAHVILSSHDDGKGNVDMCALWAPTLKTKGVKFSMFEPKIGQELYYMGAPQGVYHPPVVPLLMGLYSGEIDASNSLISIPATGGSSGSAIMDVNNRVVGVLWAAHKFHHISIMTNWRASSLFLYNVTQLYHGNDAKLITLPPIKN